jgi:tRNA (adenine57-N1/adenine58-N1)-methyltransferase
MAPPPSPFLDPGSHSAADALGILQLKRDLLIPTVLSTAPSSDYAEGKVETTRFGTFPHSTLIDQPWGAQILASVVDTGSRGARTKKRKREQKDDEDDSGAVQHGKIAKAAKASSGFVHLVPPTPETWTLCLPHRTQVVYTPDYSYILQRLRARPGDRVIEAGAGSGSFTHVAARAIFNGYDSIKATSQETEQTALDHHTDSNKRKKRRHGKVYSYEFHEPRAKQLVEEIESHGLSSVVTVTHRDVYSDGFCNPASNAEFPSYNAPNADIIFLDLPAPWLALKHLTRSPTSSIDASSPATASDRLVDSAAQSSSDASQAAPSSASPWRSPLNPKSTARICTFSPCIEQVQKTVSALRSYGWVEINMVEIQARRLEVRRERVGLAEEGLRGANPTAATVQEAVQRLRDVEGRAKIFHGMQAEKQKELMRRAEKQKRGEVAEPFGEQDQGAVKLEEKDDRTGHGSATSKNLKSNLPPSKHDRLTQARASVNARPVYKEGRLIHRTEPEIKTHTSYLVFAVLPREWTQQDEERAEGKWK